MEIKFRNYQKNHLSVPSITTQPDINKVEGGGSAIDQRSGLSWSHTCPGIMVGHAHIQMRDREKHGVLGSRGCA